MNLAELKEAYKARKLALDSAKKEEEKYKALLKDAMLEAGESDYTDEAGYRFERIVQERKSMDEEKLLAELHFYNAKEVDKTSVVFGLWEILNGSFSWGTADQIEEVWITESEIDALSLISYGVPAVKTVSVKWLKSFV